MEVVVHFLFFGAHILDVIRIGGDFDGDVFYDLDTIALESDPFDGVIGE